MVEPNKLVAIATAVFLVGTLATALAAKKPPHTAKSTCAALLKKEGAKRFDAKYGTGAKHTGAMARCVRLHTTKSSTGKSSAKTSGSKS
jgi:hypothetical protein